MCRVFGEGSIFFFSFSFFLSFWKKEELRRGEVIMRLEFRFCKGRGGLKLEVVFSIRVKAFKFLFLKENRISSLLFSFLLKLVRRVFEIL